MQPTPRIKNQQQKDIQKGANAYTQQKEKKKQKSGVRIKSYAQGKSSSASAHDEEEDPLKVEEVEDKTEVRPDVEEVKTDEVQEPSPSHQQLLWHTGNSARLAALKLGP